jgi:hypothetical protein
MPALTRHRDPDVAQETWRIHFDDVHVGTIAACVGNPGAACMWQWRCGFYTGSRPGECTNGAATSFEEARVAFEAAWCVFLSKRTEADFHAWRNQREWTESKYAAWAAGRRVLA